MKTLGKTLVFLVLGTLFGLVLSRGGATDYNVIQEMFLFEGFQLYGILGVAVAVTSAGLWLLKRRGTTAGGDPLKIPTKPLHKGTVIGSVFFGVGWSMTGMCPGPILVNIGEGKIYALSALCGALCGTYLLGVVYPHLQKRLGLP
jgi:hypothetical protein